MYGLAVMLTIPRRTTNKNIDKITFVWKKGYNIRMIMFLQNRLQNIVSQMNGFSIYREP